MMRDERLIPLALLLILAPLTLSTLPVSSGDEVKPLFEHSRTSVPQNLPWYIIVVAGDNRPEFVSWVQLPQVFYDSVREISAVNPHAFIGLGDHVGQGSRRQYEEFYRVMSFSGIANQMYAVGNHDVSYGGEAWQYWLEFMNPYTVIYDDIPGWRIVVLSTEGNYSLWSQGLDQGYKDVDGRRVILAFHRPVKPYVKHNLQDNYMDKAGLLREYLERFGTTPIVLQAHWHGWAEYHENNTDWLIVGSLGAPLYNTNMCEPWAKCVSAYHYLVLTLYPNGTHRYIPVLAGTGSGNLTITMVNQSYAIVENTKLNVYGDPTPMPVRIALHVGPHGCGYQVYIVTMAPPSSRIDVGLIETHSGLALAGNITGEDSYIYAVEDSTGKTIVVQGWSNNYILPLSVTCNSKSSPTPSGTQTSTDKTDRENLGVIVAVSVIAVAVVVAFMIARRLR